MNQQPKHLPVLLAQVLELLQPQAGESYLDLTAGFGGHARAVIAATGSPERATLVDRDQAATTSLRQEFAKATVLHQDYASASAQLKASSFDMILMDLGVSSWQFDSPERGFSLKQAGPLDMRMDSRQALDAATIVNTYSEQDLADLIYRLGEERRSRQIARAIVLNRPFSNTEQLASVITRQFRNYQRIHPATRSFMALRIAVNDELGQLEQTLPHLPILMKKNGRLAVISFHSLEDRLVKQFVKQSPDLEALNKKPLKGAELDTHNPRARSAKLRAARKI